MKRRALWVLFIIALGIAFSAWGSEIIYRLPLVGSINPVSRNFVLRAIAQAEGEQAALLLIELNTPGGLGESTRDIVMAELGATIPIVVFVGPAGARAASAGVFITMAADVAAMAPGTNIGAAHPVDLLGGGQEQDATMTDKIVNDSVAYAKAIAEERGRNVEWAEQAVRESSSLTASEALAEGVIDLVVADRGELLERLDGYGLPDGRVLRTTGLTMRDIRPSLRERLLGYLADPNLVYILFIIGLYGLIYEFFHPGIGFGLAAGGICMALALLGLQILPVNIVGIVLVLFGVLLMVLDAFTPTNGILTTGGVISLLVGSFTLFNIPSRTIGLSWSTIFITVGTMTALFVFVMSKGLLIQRKRPVTGMGGMVGAIGAVRTDLDPDGKVVVKGEYWDARSLEGAIHVGERVFVERLEGRCLLVRRLR